MTNELTERIRAPSVNIRSKVGAGDSTVAGITLGLATGNSIRNAVRFGIAAGAAAVKTKGSALCNKSDTEKLYVQIKLNSK
jgi:6-phosphofructokinase 2